MRHGIEPVGVAGASETVMTLLPLRMIVGVRCPRSRPRCPISAPNATQILSPIVSGLKLRRPQALRAEDAAATWPL